MDVPDLVFFFHRFICLSRTFKDFEVHSLHSTWIWSIFRYFFRKFFSSRNDNNVTKPFVPGQHWQHWYHNWKWRHANEVTRMHSSMMRTARSLTIRGGCLPRGCLWREGVSAQGVSAYTKSQHLCSCLYSTGRSCDLWCMLGYTSPPMKNHRQLWNITFLQLRLRVVINYFSCKFETNLIGNNRTRSSFRQT